MLESAAVRLFGTIFSGTVVAKDGSRLGLEGKAVKGVRDRSEVLDVDAKESEGVAVVKEEEWVRAGRLDVAEGANRDEDLAHSEILPPGEVPQAPRAVQRSSILLHWRAACLDPPGAGLPLYSGELRLRQPLWYLMHSLTPRLLH